MSKRKLSLLVGLIIVIFGLYFCQGSPPTFPKPTNNPKKNIRILSQNIAHGRGTAFHQLLTSSAFKKSVLQQIGYMIKKWDVDIVALQEVDFDASWSGSFNHLEIILNASNFSHKSEGNNNLKKGWLQMQYGNATLSKYPIQETSNHAFENRQMGGKGYLHSKILIDGELVHFVNLHLDHLSDSTRQKQLQTISTYLQSLNGALIVCGDFNMTIDNPIMIQFIKDHHLNRFEGNENTEPSYENIFKSVRIDFIFFSKKFKAEGMTVLKHTLSDHSGVLLDISISK